MNVLVETSVWSLALRRRPQDLNPGQVSLVRELRTLIQEGRVTMIGVVRQELLSGIKAASQFEKLKEILEAFPDESITTEDHVAAAKMGNTCRSRGVTVSLVDMLLCCVAHSRGWAIYTSDPDFGRYAKIFGLNLHAVRKIAGRSGA